MKTTAIFSILFAFILQINAQDFSPVGSIWHYTQGTINPNVTSFKTLESVLDTTINGTNCRKIIEVERYLDTVQVFYHYMYSENDSVFFYAEDAFHLLYDFGAVAGDTIVLNYFGTHNGTPLKMIIDSTKTIMVNDQERKIQFITCGDGIVIEFGHHVIEGIGNTSFMFPTPDLSLDGPLRCYQDGNTGLFLNPFHPNFGWNKEDCEEILTGIEEVENKGGISIFPNPAKHFVNLGLNSETTSMISVSIYDQMGRLWQTKELFLTGGRNDVEVGINQLPAGLYFLQVIDTNSGEAFTSKLMVGSSY